jgi:hypothetical protein
MRNSYKLTVVGPESNRPFYRLRRRPLCFASVPPEGLSVCNFGKRRNLFTLSNYMFIILT